RNPSSVALRATPSPARGEGKETLHVSIFTYSKSPGRASLHAGSASSAIHRGAAIRRSRIAHIQFTDVTARPGQCFRVHYAEPQWRDRSKPKHAGVTVRQAWNIAEIAQRLIGAPRGG